MPRRAKDWNLSEHRLEQLLRRLDPDQERAGVRYNWLRAKFVEYVRNNSRRDPEEVADIVMDRLAGKLDEVEVASPDIDRFAYSIARLVVKEVNRNYLKLVVEFALEFVRRWSNQSKPDEACLEWAIQQLADDERRLLAEYYPEETPEIGLAQHRKRLAGRLGITGEALRQRIREITRKASSQYETCRSRKIT